MLIRFSECQFSEPQSRLPRRATALCVLNFLPVGTSCVRVVQGPYLPHLAEYSKYDCAHQQGPMPVTLHRPPLLRRKIFIFIYHLVFVSFIFRVLHQAKFYACCVCAGKIGYILQPPAVGEQRVTGLAGAHCLWASRRDLKKSELEETCPISHGACDLLSKNQRRKVSGESPDRTGVSGKGEKNFAESSHCCPGRGDFRQVR